MTGWRNWALTAGALLGVCGIALWAIGAGPVLLIIGAVVMITAVLEPIYGHVVGRPPADGRWQPTDEKFVDPESNQLVTVWYNPATGERRYVAEGAESP